MPVSRTVVSIANSGPKRPPCVRPASLVIASTPRSEEYTSELQSRSDLVCRLLLEKKKKFMAAVLKVIGVDLQSHRRCPDTGRPMSFKPMADDITDIISSLGFRSAAIIGIQLGGAF